MILWLAVLGCAERLAPCDCPRGISGHGVVLESGCVCVPNVRVAADPEFTATFYVHADATAGDGSAGSPWPAADWPTIDAALATGDVLVRYEPGVWADRLDVLRTDDGPHRVVLDGGGRASVPGVHTGYDAVPRHRVTVRGFDVTGSRDKGIFWVGGDGVILEDNEVHGNRGSPSINLQYSNRTGFVSSDFVVRNNHVYDQFGECIYIGGAEGEDQDSHRGVVIENNLIHGCRSLDTKHDGINVKDRITGVVVRNDVVIGGDWSFEVASAGLYEGNVSIGALREGFHVSDGFQALPDMVFRDNVAIAPGQDGFQLTAERAPTGEIVVDGLTVVDAGEIGFAVGGSFDVHARLTDVVITGSRVAFDGWGQGEVVITSCATRDDATDFARMFEGAGPCERAAAIDVSEPAGPDGVFFTGDEPWAR